MSTPALRLRRQATPTPARGRARPRLRLPMLPAVLAYGIPSLVAALAVQAWFRGGGVLAGGDLTPPFTPGVEYRSHWNQVEAGEGVPTFSIVSFPYYEGLRLFDRLGLDEATFQRVWLSLLLVAATASVVFLSRSLVRSPLAAAAAGLLSLLNGYHLATGFDPVPLAAMIAAAMFGGLLIRAGVDEDSVVTRALLFALISVPLSIVFANPAQAFIVCGWLAASVVLALAAYGTSVLLPILRLLALALPLTLLFNLWWIVPALQTLLGPTFSDRFAAPGVEEWAWTHARASLENVIGLTSAWGWLEPQYFPFAPELERLPLSPFQYVLAAAALLGLALTLALGSWRERRLALSLAGIAAIGVWIVKGLHEPLGSTNRWLYEHGPGFWLLREPTKVSLVIVLAFSLLAALGIGRLQVISPWLAGVVAVTIVAGAGAYAHPLLDGTVVADRRPLLPPAHVRVPTEWRLLANSLDGDPKPGKVVVLPRLDYYQAPTDWGYYGASFFHQLVKRPVIEVLPGGYYRNGDVAELVGSLQSRILQGGDVRPLLQALGARYILIRRDLDTRFPGRTFGDPAALAARLDSSDYLANRGRFGVADVFEASAATGAEVFAATPLVRGVVGSAALRRALDPSADYAFVASSAERLLHGVPSGHVRVFKTSQGPHQLTIERDRSILIRVRRIGAPGSEWAVRFPADATSLRVIANRSSVTLGENTVATVATTPTSLLGPDSLTGVELIALRPELSRQVGDCNRYDTRTPREVGIAARVSGDRILKLQARDHSACVSFPLTLPRVDKSFRLELEHRGVRGASPRLCVWQEGPNHCADLRPLSNSVEWRHFSTTVRPKPGTRSLRLFLYADGTGKDHESTVTEYRRISVARSAPSIAIAVAPDKTVPRISYRRLGPAAFRVDVVNAVRPFLLVLAETFADGWRLDTSSRSQDAAEAQHLRVNDYANGWRVPWSGTYELTLRYEPERRAALARHVDLAAVPLGVCGLLAWLLTTGGDRRRRK